MLAYCLLVSESAYIMEVTTKTSTKKLRRAGCVKLALDRFVTTVRMTRNSEHQKQRLTRTWQGLPTKERNGLYNFSQEKTA